MHKIPPNYKLTKFRAVLGGEMKGKMKTFEQYKVQYYQRNKMET